MTSNKHFKRRVRDRARRTGESYTAALRHLRLNEANKAKEAKEQQMQWQRVEKLSFGYAVHVPAGWGEYPPDLVRNPIETARFADPADRRHGLVVFRGMPHPGLSALEAAERTQATLEAAGYADFLVTRARVAGWAGARLDCAKHDAGRTSALREYFVAHDDVRFVLGCHSFVPDEDDALFAEMAERFEILGLAPAG
jgi:hypothetical protein